MLERTFRVILLTLCVLGCGSMGSTISAQGAIKGIYPVIVLAADGTGDFGPNTPNTTTAGWQEAVNYCKQHAYDLFVKGGSGGQDAVFNVSTTITFPPVQDFRIEGGNYTINWTGGNAVCLSLDSQMDARLHFSRIVYNQGSAAVRFHTTNPVPLDNTPLIIESQFTFDAIIGQNAGTGVLWEPTNGGITFSDFNFGEISGFATCMKTSDNPNTNRNMTHNNIRVTDLYNNLPNSTYLYVGSYTNDNTFQIGGLRSDGSANVKGLDITGIGNDIQILFGGNFNPNINTVVFEPTAAKNQVNLVTPPGVGPDGLVTDLATDPSNEVTGTDAPLPIRSWTAPTGTYNYTQRLWPAIARVVGGAISSVKLLRGANSIDYGTSREAILLSVGDTLQVTSSNSPTIQLIPFKMR